MRERADAAQSGKKPVREKRLVRKRALAQKVFFQKKSSSQEIRLSPAQFARKQKDFTPAFPLFQARFLIFQAKKQEPAIFLSGTKALSEKLGVPVLEISAMKGTGIDRVTEKAIALAKSGEVAPVKHSFSAEVEDYIQKVEEKLLPRVEYSINSYRIAQIEPVMLEECNRLYKENKSRFPDKERRGHDERGHLDP